MEVEGILRREGMVSDVLVLTLGAESDRIQVRSSFGVTW